MPFTTFYRLAHGIRHKFYMNLHSADEFQVRADAVQQFCLPFQLALRSDTYPVEGVHDGEDVKLQTARRYSNSLVLVLERGK